MLYKHQQEIIAENKPKTGLWLGTGSAKTRIALYLAEGKTLVICPKTQKNDRNWEREVQKIQKEDKKFHIDLTVISKEEFRSIAYNYRPFDTVIGDEAHTLLGVTPNIKWIKKRPEIKTSQLFTELKSYIERTQPKRLYLCTATIIRSPMTVWGAAKILGLDWDFYKFRNMFYFQLPMPGRQVFTAKIDDESKEELAKLVRSIGYVGRLEDYFDVPQQTYKTISVELSADQKARIKQMTLEYPEPIVRIGKIHQIENGTLTGDEFVMPEYFNNEKINILKDLALEFPRMVVFAKYSLQIAQIETELTQEGYRVITLTGNTQNRGEVMARANEAKECIFLAQAQMSAGWELPDYPVMIFASRTYSFVDYDQGLGRIQRANNIKKNLYINLVAKGGIDEAVDKCISQKQDFNEKLYIQEHD